MEKVQKNISPVVNKSVKSKTNLSTVQFKDNRLELTTQLRIKEIANNHSRASANHHPIQKKENKTGMPDNLKSGIENLSGLDMSDVKVHYNSSQPVQFHAYAFAQGNQIHLGPGQEKHLPHEAWHVVQQKQGRVAPTKQLKGKLNINDDSGLEREADMMGQRALMVADKKTNQTQLKLSNPTNRSGNYPMQMVTMEDFKAWLISQEGRFRGAQGGNATVRPEDIPHIIRRLNECIETREDLAEFRDEDHKMKHGWAVERKNQLRALLADQKNNNETLLLVAKEFDTRAKGYGASLDDMKVWSEGNAKSDDVPADLMADLKVVRTFLSNEGLVSHYLGLIDDAIGQKRKPGREAYSAATAAASSGELTALSGYEQVAREIEEAGGYGREVGKIGIEATILEGAKAVRGFARKGQPFVDFGVEANHGAETHRIQQLVLSFAFKRGDLRLSDGVSPVDIYKHLGRTDLAVFEKRENEHYVKRRENAGIRKKLYVWELVLDRFDAAGGVFLIDQETGQDIVRESGESFDGGIPVSLQSHMTSKEGGEYRYRHLGLALEERRAQQTEELRVGRERTRAERERQLTATRRATRIKLLLFILGLIIAYFKRHKIIGFVKWVWQSISWKK